MLGETWNLAKIGFQLKQVRERLAKGLVDKGILRTEKRNFLLFDMATHPVQDAKAKSQVVQQCIEILLSRSSTTEFVGSEKARRLVLVCAAYGANVLENVLTGLEFEDRERAMEKAEVLMGQCAAWPAERVEFKELQVKKECLELIAGVVYVFMKMDSVI